MKATIYNFYECLLINNIDFEGYDVPKIDTLSDKLNQVDTIFRSEFIHKNNQDQNKVVLFANWLQKPPSVLTVPFMYVDILERAQTFYKANADRELRAQLREEDRFLSSYWLKLANAFYGLKNNPNNNI